MKPTDQAQWQGVVESWLAQDVATQGVIVDPAGFVTMADTGQLVEGWYDFIFRAMGTAAYWSFGFHHRNAADAATLYLWIIPVSIHIVNDIYISNWYMATNERIRALAGAAVVGSFVCEVTWVKRA